MPVLPAVAIILPLGLAPELSNAVLRNCDLAIGSGGCSLTSSEAAPTRAAWLARVVRPADGARAVRVELVPAVNSPTTAAYSRWLSFDDNDRPIHQWSAVGVVIAALAIAAEAERNHTGNADPKSAEPSDTDRDLDLAQPKPDVGRAGPPKAPASANPLLSEQQRLDATASHAAAPRVVRNGLRLDLGALLAPGLESSQPRYGVTLRPSVELTRRLALGGQLTASHANGQATTNWFSGEFGLAFVATPADYRWSLETRLFALIEELTFGAADASGDKDEASRWRGGVAAGIDAIVPFSNPFGWFVAVDGRLAFPRIRVQIASNEVAEVPTSTFVFSTGLRWRIAFAAK